MNNDRFFAFFGENRASLAMDIQNTDGHKNLTFAIALCNHRDNFNKKIARSILDGRLNAALDSSRSRQTKMTFKTSYSGDHPKRDVMAPLMRKLRNLPKDREYNTIRDMLEQVSVTLVNKEGCQCLRECVVD